MLPYISATNAIYKDELLHKRLIPLSFRLTLTLLNISRLTSDTILI